MAKQSFSKKIGDWIRHILSCCDKEDEEEKRPALQIVSPNRVQSQLYEYDTDSECQSGPTNFRREDITIPGLDPEQ